MNIYVETNFVLELALLQEESEFCEQLLEIAERGEAQLVLPAYSLVEPYETLIRHDKNRKRLATDLENELNQLDRSQPYKSEINPHRTLIQLLIRSGEEEQKRLINVRNTLLATADIIPLSLGIIDSAQLHEAEHGLSPQDAIVYASTLWHLDQTQTPISCFINRNSKDFNDPDIETALANFNCKALYNFTNGLGYVMSKLT